MSDDIQVGRFQVQEVKNFFISPGVSGAAVTLRLLTGPPLAGEIVITMTDPDLASQFNLRDVFRVKLDREE